MRAGGNMWGLDGWRQVTCAESNAHRAGTCPVSSLTDLSGEYGVPIVYTEWASGERVALRDYREPGGECTHYMPEATS